MGNWSIDKITELLNQAGNYSNCHCDNCVKFHSQSKEIIRFLLDERERVRDIVANWASDRDAIDDLDALCRIAEVFNIEVCPAQTILTTRESSWLQN